MLLTEPLLRCLGGLFGIIVMLEDPATGLDMGWLKQEDTSGTAGFDSLSAYSTTDGNLCCFGPGSLQVIHQPPLTM